MPEILYTDHAKESLHNIAEYTYRQFGIEQVQTTTGQQIDPKTVSRHGETLASFRIQVWIGFLRGKQQSVYTPLPPKSDVLLG